MFTPFELVARHRNADADVENDAAIVNPTRAATIKRFITGPFQVSVVLGVEMKAEAV